MPTIAHQLSLAQRRCLFEHIHGPQPHKASPGPGETTRKTKETLLDLKLLRTSDNNFINNRPEALILTEAGKDVVCYLLGQFADILVAAGCMGEEALTSRQVFERIDVVVKHRKKSCATTSSFVDATPPDESYVKIIAHSKNASERLLALLREQNATT